MVAVILVIMCQLQNSQYNFKTEMIKVNSKQRFASIKEFTIIEDRKIGCGSFGIVRLARHRKTCRMYALKIINLKEVPSESQLKLVQREIRLHLEMDHPHIIKLWDALLQDDYVYMIMEYAENGNLFYHQNTKNIFSEVEAFKFFSQTLDAIQYLHKHDIIHRDLKPENLLLDNIYNIKICDFGWCAEDIKAKRSTFCGTYQYMAPEMLFKAEYDYKVDVWALGVLLYEMLHGCAPFKGKTAQEVQEAMLKGNYELGYKLSQNVKRLIHQILQFQPDKRLKIEEILQHPWIREIENYINTYLQNQKAVLPKQIHTKLAFAPPMVHVLRQKNGQGGKRRKNNSLNFEQNGHNININLQINNFSIIGKHNKSKNNFHSQQKSKDHQEYGSINNVLDNVKSSGLRKNKIQVINSAQKGDININRMMEKIKSAKSAKLMMKHMGSSQKQKKKKEYPHDATSKKKFKLRKSQVEFFNQKIPVRFNTQANEKDEWWCEPSKLKKTNIIKGKQMVESKSVLRMNKS